MKIRSFTRAIFGSTLIAPCALLVLAFTTQGALAAQGIPFPGNKIPQFVDPLPLLNLTTGTTTGIETHIDDGSEITVNMLELQANMLPSTFVPANGQPYTGTWVFGYRVGPTAAPATAVDSYIGPVIVATRNQPTQVRYVNNLTANNIHWRDWIDQSLHSAFHQAAGQPMPTSGDTSQYLGPVLAVPHLHGGEDPAITDGGPEAWFASNVSGPDTTTYNVSHGPAYYAGTDVVGGGAHPAAANESIYRYPNTQEAAPMWFHDHLLGGTRINATFAGLAGAYPLIDPNLNLPTGLDPVGLGEDSWSPSSSRTACSTPTDSSSSPTRASTRNILTGFLSSWVTPSPSTARSGRT